VHDHRSCLPGDQLHNGQRIRGPGRSRPSSARTTSRSSGSRRAGMPHQYPTPQPTACHPEMPPLVFLRARAMARRASPTSKRARGAGRRPRRGRDEPQTARGQKLGAGTRRTESATAGRGIPLRRSAVPSKGQYPIWSSRSSSESGRFPALGTEPYVSGFLTPVAINFFIPLVVYQIVVYQKSSWSVLARLNGTAGMPCAMERPLRCRPRPLRPTPRRYKRWRKRIACDGRASTRHTQRRCGRRREVGW
jgi:hypothetical protein